MSCKGICHRYKAPKPSGTGRYASGQKRCQICEIFIKYESLWCPCCGYRMRTRPRGSDFKRKFRGDMQDSTKIKKETWVENGKIQTREITNDM